MHLVLLGMLVIKFVPNLQGFFLIFNYKNYVIPFSKSHMALPIIWTLIVDYDDNKTQYSTSISWNYTHRKKTIVAIHCKLNST